MGHSPGPWIHSDTVSIRDECGDHICILQVDGCQKYGGVNAVGRLITAAPDLLVALKELMADHDGFSQETLDRARLAIARAEG